MKVLICIPCLLTGGTEIQTLSLVRALVQAGYRVTTVCYFEHSEQMVLRYREAGSEVVCLSKEGERPYGVSRTFAFLWKGLKHCVKTYKPDIAHVQYMAPGAIPIVILRLLAVKKILATAHTMADIYPNLRTIHFLQRHILTAFICITLTAEKSFFGTSQLYSKNLQLKKRGNHFTIYNCLPENIQIKKEPKQFGETITIGVVSRLEIIKGMDLVVPAFIQIHQKYPKTRLLVVGDGSLRQMMEQEARGISNITFLGRQPQEKLQEVYDQIDILLMPSRSEGFGLTALEGMARGCVVVASDVGGLPEIVSKSGIICKSSAPSDYAQNISLFLSDLRGLKMYSSLGMERARAFSMISFQEIISSFYHSI